MSFTTYILSIFYFFNSQQISNQQLSTQSDAFFNKYVTEKGVDYSAIKNDPTQLSQLTDIVEKTSIDKLSKNDKATFYINSYNILVIKSVIDNYPINSPLKVKGFFDEIKHKVAGVSLTLNDIENIKLREDFGDERIHFALVCAGKGCPPISKKAFFSESLNERLQYLTEAALNNPNFIRVDDKNKKVEISQIFEWYQGDFGKNIEEVIQYINKYRNNPIPLSYSKGYYEYDWSLNGY
ncbi:MAG: DUF547 domain-containing protein [Chitinophagales bacterium]